MISSRATSLAFSARTEAEIGCSFLFLDSKQHAVHPLLPEEHMNNQKFIELSKRIAARGGIIAFFIVAFEVMIMISPFAFFFYSVFNPVLLWLDGHWATRWLTGFFLPHMILPPTPLLKTVRVTGSLLFIIGCLGFFFCAAQVYLGKIFKWGIASKGLYRSIRHPQYLTLGLWGTGMAILWPRFLVLASLSLMFILYYFLAKDEERRMLGLYGDGYRQYMERTGMFLPRAAEAKLAGAVPLPRNSSTRHALIAFLVPVVVLGLGFLLREITLRSLLYQANANVTLISILPEDDPLSRKALRAVTTEAGSPAKVTFLKDGKDYLGYVMPADYVMQGMIADTGDTFHLHKQHHTLALIMDWVLHPFEHLRRSPSAVMAEMNHVDPAMARRHHCPLGIPDQTLQCEACPYRRIVFIKVDHGGAERLSQEGLFSFGTSRTPVGFVDINTTTGELVNVKSVGKATAWKDVPTPAL